jgi:ketosteroid isomerase-like protein
VTRAHEDLFRRYMHAGAISHDADAFAALFTPDGVYEAPLVPPGHRLPSRLEGREAIRAGIGAYHREPGFQGTVDIEQSSYVLHETADPDVFITEIDTVLTQADGTGTTMSLVQIYRLHDGLIALLRDYFPAPPA